MFRRHFIIRECDINNTNALAHTVHVHSQPVTETKRVIHTPTVLQFCSFRVFFILFFLNIFIAALVSLQLDYAFVLVVTNPLCVRTRDGSICQVPTSHIKLRQVWYSTRLLWFRLVLMPESHLCTCVVVRASWAFPYGFSITLEKRNSVLN